MSLLRSFLSVSSITFLSRPLGLVRDILIAGVFGAGAVADAFFAAFRLPNTLRRFTAEGALTQAFVPVYAERRQNNAQAAAAVAGEALTLLVCFLLAASALAALFAPWVVAALAPGLKEPELAADILRVVFPYIVFVSAAALLAGMLNARGRFAAAACAPLWLNAALIAACLLSDAFSPPIFALAWGVFAGGVLQLAWLAFFAKRAGVLPRFVALRAPGADARRVLRLLWRGALGAGATQINLLINLFIASFLAAGSISWLYYADRLMELPVGVLGAALATVALPKLAANAGNAAAYNRLLNAALRLALFFSLPAAAGLALLALPLTATLFMRGAFSAHDAQMTQQAALAYAVGVAGLAGVRPLAAAFFAKQDAKTPVRAACVALLTTQALNGVFVLGLGWGHSGLALSVGVAACVNAAVLLVVLLRRGWLAPDPAWRAFARQTLPALALMCLLLAFAAPPAAWWLAAGEGARAAALAALFFGGGGVYLAAAAALGARPRDFFAE